MINLGCVGAGQETNRLEKSKPIVIGYSYYEHYT